MPWKVKKLRKIGPFWLPSRGPIEHVDLRPQRATSVAHRPLFGHGTRHHEAAVPPDERPESH